MLTFLILSVGFLSEQRILSKFWEEKIIRDHQKKILTLLFFIFSVTIAISFQKKPIFVWFVMFIANLLSFLVPFIIQKRRKYDFEQETIALIDNMINSIKSGRSFRETIKRFQAEKESRSYYFHEIFQAISFDQAPDRISSDTQVQRLYVELKQISKSQHRIADRLASLRRILKTENWFKQKTKQVLLQSRAQSIIMTILYLGLFGYVFLTDQMRDNFDLIMISITLYLCGTVWLWKMGRSYQWKV